ncbi:MAG: CBS domain-containing protein [Chloroflexi bacterium]|nr:CBS domain-containing protein [Chloroflexota bacterium]
MSNITAYLDSFAAIERHLRGVTKRGREATFYTLVDEAARSDSAVRRYRDDLKEFADLRNAVVHERGGGQPIAEPNDWAVAQLQKITDQLIRPPRVLPHFQVNVISLTPAVSIAEAVVIMHERSFSQIPIYEDDQFVGLLTSNTIARWLGASVADDVFSLGETSIHQVLAHTEDPDHVGFCAWDTTLIAVAERFQAAQDRGKRLDALLITQNGKPNERPLGIIAVFDLVTINRILAA